MIKLFPGVAVPRFSQWAETGTYLIVASMRRSGRWLALCQERRKQHQRAFYRSGWRMHLVRKEAEYEAFYRVVNGASQPQPGSSGKPATESEPVPGWYSPYPLSVSDMADLEQANFVSLSLTSEATQVRPSSRPGHSVRPEPLIATNEAGWGTSLTTDSHGNLPDIEDPYRYLTTMTYTVTDRVLTVINADDRATTYPRDSQGRKRRPGRKQARSE